jgi:transposase
VGQFLREDQSERLYELLQREPKIHTKDRVRERRFLEAVYWMARSGAQWRFLPAAYGAWNSVYKRFARWADLGVWQRLLEGVADDPDLQSVLIDATVVRAHTCAAGAPATGGIGRPRGWGARAAASAPSSMCWSTRWATRSSSS